MPTTIDVTEARELAYAALTNRGVDERQARIITDVVMEAELAGRSSHGLIRIPRIAGEAAERGSLMPRSEETGPVSVMVHGNGCYGYVAAHVAMSEAIRLARDNGVGLAGVNDSGHTGMMGYYVMMAAAEDLVGIGLCNTRPMVAPTGLMESILGTNPLAVAIPSSGAPFLLDMATSAATFGDILVAEHSGTALPPDSAIDRHGSPTTDPRAAKSGSLLPFDGHKGFGLSMAVQILSTALVQQAPEQTGGALMMAVDPATFIPIADFKAAVSAQLTAIKGARRAPGAEEPSFPGERRHRHRTDCLGRGIVVDRELLEQLRRLT